jgi:nitrite reductase/ring-hydroxylating ferredoxin subunit
MAADPRLICASEALVDGGTGIVFELSAHARGFAVRYCGTARAYVNRCPHAGTELDWQPGEFFEETGLYLMCSTHGALFEPSSGYCVAGPCRGASLEPLAIKERDGQVILLRETPMNRRSEADEQ